MSEVIFGRTTGVELCLSWRPASNGDIPEDAVNAGQECFVARAKHENQWVPGKIVRGQGCAHISFRGKEEKKTCYEVLVCSGINCFGSGRHWVAVSGGELPNRVLIAGSEKCGTVPLFVARGTRPELNGEMCTGKAILGLKRAYVPWGGEEHALDTFEVLAFTCSQE